MIVDTMSFEEISKYLWKTSFSQETLEKMDSSKPYLRKKKLFLLEIRKWKYNNHPEKYRIFKPVYYKGKNDETLVTVYYSGDGVHLDFINFVTFYHRGKKYVAMKSVIPGSVMFYSLHCLRRYSERFLGDLNPEIDDIFIGDFLIYNASSMERRYTHDGKESILMVSTDGSFLCDKPGEGIYVARTFISEKEYFKEQKELDKETLRRLKRYWEEVWGETIEEREGDPG